MVTPFLFRSIESRSRQVDESANGGEAFEMQHPVGKTRIEYDRAYQQK
jgi:hypothetical protein